MNRALIVLVAALVGCGDPVDEAWELDHDRLIAIRATPSRIASAETATLDALLGAVGEDPRHVQVETAAVITPTSLAAALSQQGTQWTVTAPDAATLAAARTELELAVDADVPLQLRMTFVGTDKIGRKTIYLGTHVDNPMLSAVMIDGTDARTATSLVVASATDIPLSVAYTDEDYDVNWLTSCGTLHDFDLPTAYLRVEPEDPPRGTLGVVVRDHLGGVAWQFWPITSE